MGKLIGERYIRGLKCIGKVLFPNSINGYVDVSSIFFFSSVQLLSRVKLCDSMDCRTPGLPVHHQLPDFTQTHIHWVSDAIQPCHPFIPFSSCLQSFSASVSFPVSQFFTSGGQSIGVSDSAPVFPKTIQDWFPLGWTGLILQSIYSQESFPTPQFKSINSSALRFLYCPTLTSIHDYIHYDIHNFD